MRSSFLSRRSALVSVAAGAFAFASLETVGHSLSRSSRSPRDLRSLLSSVYASPGGARAVGRVYLQANPNEGNADKLIEALFGAEPPLSTHEVRARLGAARDADFRTGRTVVLGGWLMALTEARWCGLALLLNDSA